MQPDINPELIKSPWVAGAMGAIVALRECLAFLDNGSLPAVPGPAADVDIPEDVFQAVVLMVSADYDASPEKRTAYRAAAEQLLWPYKSF